MSVRYRVAIDIVVYQSGIFFFQLNLVLQS